MRIFVSAAPSCRSRALPNLIAGVELEVGAKDRYLTLLALLPPGALTDPEATPPSGDRLIARPTGRTYRGLPWWEATLQGDTS